MPDIVSVSDSLERLNAKTRLAADTVTITDGVTILVAKQVSKSLTQTVAITEQAVITQRTKTRLISQTTTIAEQLKAYKNDVELVPVSSTRRNTNTTKHHRHSPIQSESGTREHRGLSL